jgi:hypothetical protein
MKLKIELLNMSDIIYLSRMCNDIHKNNGSKLHRNIEIICMVGLPQKPTCG